MAEKLVTTSRDDVEYLIGELKKSMDAMANLMQAMMVNEIQEVAMPSPTKSIKEVNRLQVNAMKAVDDLGLSAKSKKKPKK